jgi:hypothetical protein
MGVVDIAGNVVIPARYEHISPFRDGWAIVKHEGRWLFVDRTGAVVFDRKDGDIASEFFEGLTPIRKVVSKPGKKVVHRWGYIDRAGKLVIPAKFVRAHDFSEGLAAVEPDPKLGFMWGFIDKSGKIVIEPQWHGVNDFHEGLAAVAVGEKFGYIDRTGKLVIPAKFDFAMDFVDGLAQVEVHVCPAAHRDAQGRCTQSRTDQPGYIDRQGNYVLAPSVRSPAATP